MALLGTPQKPGRKASRRRPALSHFAAKSTDKLRISSWGENPVEIWGVPNKAIFKMKVRFKAILHFENGFVGRPLDLNGVFPPRRNSKHIGGLRREMGKCGPPS